MASELFEMVTRRGQGLATIEERLFLSFRRKPESREEKDFWTPAFAGVTAEKAFYEVFKEHSYF